MPLKIELSEGDQRLRLPPDQLLARVRRAEAMGFDGYGIPDLVRYGTDVLSLFAAAAVQTERITLFPNVSNPITRSPWVLANAALTINRLAHGRFRLTLGAGTYLNLGRRPARMAEMRETVLTIRRLLAGEDVTLGEASATADGPPAGDAKGEFEDYERLHREGLIGVDGRDAPPVSLAVGGPRMTELAGEVADEVMTLGGHDPRTVAAVRALLQTGAARSGRSLEDFKIAHWAFVCIDDDEHVAMERMRDMLLGFPVGTHLSPLSLEALGLDWPLDRLEDVPVSQWRQFIDAVAFAGPAEKIAERLQDVQRDGQLDRLVCGIWGQDYEAAVEAFARTVIPRLR